MRRLCVAALALLTCAALSCGGDDEGPTGLTVGALQVTLSMTGEELDPDGCQVSVDGGSPEVITAGSSVSFTGLEAGSHSVLLDDVASNCTVAGPNPRSVSVAVGTTTPVTFGVTCSATTGSLVVDAVTTGESLDPDGYTVTLDGGASRELTVNGTVMFPDLAPGSHEVELGDVADNCTIADGGTRTVQVTAGSSTETTFSITCAVPVGNLVVTTATTGGDLDPDGYEILLDGVATGQSLAVNGDTITITGVTEGTHEVSLGNVAAWCSVAEPDPRSVTVVAGQTVQEAFSVGCDWTTRIAYTSCRWDAEELPHCNIYVMKPDGSESVKLTDVYVDSSYQEFASNPDWSPDGSRIAFSAGGDFMKSIYDVYVINADGTGLVKLTDHPSDVDQAEAEDPSWSPDGIRIAFVYVAEHIPYEAAGIWVMNADGTGQGNLTNLSGWDDDPAWSPDGSRIAFTYSDDIWVMDADGTGLISLTDHVAMDRYPAWSPDGTRIAFESDRDGDREIYVMNRDGTGLVKLTDHPGGDSFPSWSPDGSRITFTSTRDGNPDIWVMDADGTGLVRLTNNPGSDYHPDWSPVLD
jgi:TolB protein